MTAAGFALTLYVFYPGVMTFDALYIYKDMAKGNFGDWQSPAMLALWSFIDPIAPGTGSMLLLTVTLYWLSFAAGGAGDCAALSASLRSCCRFFALSPPAFVLVGVIWRDILFAIVWMLGAVAVFAAADRELEIARSGPDASRSAYSRLASCCARMRSLPRHILAAYIIWPKQFSWKRTALLYVPAALALFGLVQVVYYDVFNAQRQNPLHSIMVFDLGGISHFAKENVFPGTWTATGDTTLITDGCYKSDRMGHLLDATAVFVRDGTSRRRDSCSVRLLSPKLGGTRSFVIQSPIWNTALYLFLDVPCRREPGDVVARPRRSRQDHLCRQAAPDGGQGAQ